MTNPNGIVKIPPNPFLQVESGMLMYVGVRFDPNDDISPTMHSHCLLRLACLLVTCQEMYDYGLSGKIPDWACTIAQTNEDVKNTCQCKTAGTGGNDDNGSCVLVGCLLDLFLSGWDFFFGTSDQSCGVITGLFGLCSGAGGQGTRMLLRSSS